jgi:hypothetical protein
VVRLCEWDASRSHGGRVEEKNREIPRNAGRLSRGLRSGSALIPGGKPRNPVGFQEDSPAVSAGIAVDSRTSVPRFPRNRSRETGRLSVVPEASLEEAGMLTTFLGQKSFGLVVLLNKATTDEPLALDDLLDGASWQSHA